MFFFNAVKYHDVDRLGCKQQGRCQRVVHLTTSLKK